jgi:hypothetical protein
MIIDFRLHTSDNDFSLSFCDADAVDASTPKMACKLLHIQCAWLSAVSFSLSTIASDFYLRVGTMSAIMQLTSAEASVGVCERERWCVELRGKFLFRLMICWHI